ncbi:MAG: response regulator [Magnetococcales bacterium]|nr:response regulator [Magnetococcales bacterium]
MRILIADDHRVYREVLKAMLQPYGECVTVEDGEQAVQVFGEALKANQPFQLVLLDIQMPYMDGQEALVQIRSMEKKIYGPTLDIKNYSCIIMQTSVDDPVSLITAFKRGHCNGFINKPVDMEELLDKIKKHGLI